MDCQHNLIVGDNYGQTCAECGEVIAGYGEWATGSRECVHVLVREETDLGVITRCLYCDESFGSVDEEGVG